MRVLARRVAVVAVSGAALVAVACGAGRTESSASSIPLGVSPEVTFAIGGAGSDGPAAMHRDDATAALDLALDLGPRIAVRGHAVAVAWMVRQPARQVYVASSADTGATFSKPHPASPSSATVEQVARSEVGASSAAATPPAVLFDIQDISTAVGADKATPSTVHAAVLEDQTLVAVWNERDAPGSIVKFARALPMQHAANTAPMLHRILTETLGASGQLADPSVAPIDGGAIAAWRRDTGGAPVVVVRRVGLETLCLDPAASATMHHAVGGGRE